jgi:hypothetical protein
MICTETWVLRNAIGSISHDSINYQFHLVLKKLNRFLTQLMPHILLSLLGKYNSSYHIL